jgi:hypothetical protein
VQAFSPRRHRLTLQIRFKSLDVGRDDGSVGGERLIASCHGQNNIAEGHRTIEGVRFTKWRSRFEVLWRVRTQPHAKVALYHPDLLRPTENVSCVRRAGRLP